MEALILDAICEDQENKIIVDLCRDHVDHVQPFAWRYISKNRLKSKAYLGVTWAIQYPEKIFSLIDEQMRSIRWGDSAVLKECFKQLSDL